MTKNEDADEGRMIVEESKKTKKIQQRRFAFF
jgi:hypothetical protein